MYRIRPLFSCETLSCETRLFMDFFHLNDQLQRALGAVDALAEAQKKNSWRRKSMGGAAGGRAARCDVCVCVAATWDRDHRIVLLTTKALSKKIIPRTRHWARDWRALALTQVHQCRARKEFRHRFRRPRNFSSLNGMPHVIQPLAHLPSSLCILLSLHPSAFRRAEQNDKTAPCEHWEPFAPLAGSQIRL